ncbi:MAG TPA: pyridoxal-phosphate dependent enzyme [Puia sp.]|nr:pyridoxal-phosphate dependent enzyme [Puia sp.]
MENILSFEKRSRIGNEVSIAQQCTNCGSRYGLDVMLSSCTQCKGRLEYVYDGQYKGTVYPQYDSLWKNFDLLPLIDPANIVSMGEGGSSIIEMEELSGCLNGARLFLMMDSDKNPTGVFKDREASIIISRCKELGLDNLVFYSTANTGRSYMHYAAKVGLTTYLFMPRQCHYKNTKHVDKKENNFIIYVDDHYPEISPFAKKFAEKNGLTAIAPIHDRNEAYATVAYEQFQQLPECKYFVQTIASGMGPIGFLKGHRNLVRFGLQQEERIPRVICVQSSQMNAMARAYNAGKTVLRKEDLPSVFDDALYEPTLNSTNPVNNYGDLYDCLKTTNGIITDVEPGFVEEVSSGIIEAFQKRNIVLRADIEKSILIEFAGLVRLAAGNQFEKGEAILMLACGRGKDTSSGLYEPDIVINPSHCDPVGLKNSLDAL